MCREEPDVSNIECLFWYTNIPQPRRNSPYECIRTGGMGKAKQGFPAHFLLSCQYDVGMEKPSAVSLVKKTGSCSRLSPTNCLRLVPWQSNGGESVQGERNMIVSIIFLVS